MNVERLHGILIALKKELTEGRVSSNLQSMVSALEAVVNQATAPNQQNLATQRSALYAALTDRESDRFSPTWRQVLREIGGEQFFGSVLKQRVEEAFANNQITPAVALSELRGLLQQLQAFEGAVNSAVAAFRQFGVGDEELEPGECEIAALIPRQAVGNELLRFGKELKELAFIANTFSEVATGKPSELGIKTVSSSDLLVILNASAPYAACFAVAIERVVSLYKQLLEIRKLHHEIREQGVPEEETTGIEKYANQLMEKGIENASKEVIEEFYRGNDKGRKHELTIQVRLSMNKIANRIDHGFNLEVRAEPPVRSGDEAKDAENERSVAQVQAATPSMQFLKLEGQPLLRLPEANEKPKRKAKEKEEGARCQSRMHSAMMLFPRVASLECH